VQPAHAHLQYALCQQSPNDVGRRQAKADGRLELSGYVGMYYAVLDVIEGLVGLAMVSHF
jgi:hypothetical protein